MIRLTSKINDRKSSCVYTLNHLSLRYVLSEIASVVSWETFRPHCFSSLHKLFHVIAHINLVCSGEISPACFMFHPKIMARLICRCYGNITEGGCPVIKERFWLWICNVSAYLSSQIIQYFVITNHILQVINLFTSLSALFSYAILIAIGSLHQTAATRWRQRSQSAEMFYEDF